MLIAENSHHCLYLKLKSPKPYIVGIKCIPIKHSSDKSNFAKIIIKSSSESSELFYIYKEILMKFMLTFF